MSKCGIPPGPGSPLISRLLLCSSHRRPLAPYLFQSLLPRSSKVYASNRPIPSPPFSSFLIALLPNPESHDRFSRTLVATSPPRTSSPPFPVVVRAAHPFRRSDAHIPHEDKYAPAFWPAAATDACALERSGARAAKRSEDVGALVSVEMVSDERGWEFS